MTFGSGSGRFFLLKAKVNPSQKSADQAHESLGHSKTRWTDCLCSLHMCILKVETDIDYAFIDRMLLVCAALIKISPTVVPLNCH